MIAITEHETISNAIKVEKYYKKIKEKHPDFKVILGNEIYLCRNGLSPENITNNDKFYHFILLAKDAIGHEQIRELSTKAWNRSFTYKGLTRVPTYYQDLVDIVQANKGHVIGSTACLGGFLPTKLLQYHTTKDTNLYQNILGWCHSIQNIFGVENFYLELQPSNNNEQIIVNKYLVQIAKELNIPYIITTDSHYLKKEDASIHKAFLNSQDGDREIDSFYSSTYLMGTEEIEEYLNYFSKDILEAAYNSILNIKNNCTDYSLLKALKIPSLTWKIPEKLPIKKEYFQKMPTLTKFVNSDFDGDKILAQSIINKIENDPRLQTDQTYAEIEDNLNSTWISSEVNKTHWSAYFLNLQKIIDVCWDAGTLVGPGRGSGVGFILLYLLDIIQINPLWETTKCFSWRFLNPERVSVLDIDTDIEGGRRAQVLEALRKFYGYDRVSNVVTFGTEGTRSAIQTAARGLGIDNDISTYLSSLIPSDRGATRTLKECYYGDAEKGFAPVAEFKKEMDINYPKLWEVAQKIEGLICRVGEHAGGVIFVDEPFTKSTALMKVPNGDTVTQFDLHDCEDASLIKIDLLSVECLDKIHNCLDLLIKDKRVIPKETLRETYEDTIGIYKLNRTDPDMWHMVWDHKIQSLFQMEQPSGVQGIALIHPKSVDELCVLNSVIRLMASEKGGEQPLSMWARYRKNINDWIQEMKNYGLNPEEIEWLSGHSAITNGICESQEGLMSLVQEERLGGNSLTFADKCRKGIAKKVGSLFQECEDIYYKNVKEKGCSEKLAHYVWDVLLKVQRGYSFNRSHCLAYSLVALQEMNLCLNYPIIYWNTACLVTDGGNENSGTDYDKIAIAINKMIKSGIKIGPPNVNSSDLGFIPDAENNQILFGLKGMLHVGDDVIKATIENRPYSSIKEYIAKVNPNKQAMVSLIKGGAFDTMMDRKLAMGWYLWETCDKKNNITMQNMASLNKYGLLPKDGENELAYKIYEFTRYLKSKCKFDNQFYLLDDRAFKFMEDKGLIDIITMQDNKYLLEIKSWEKVYKYFMTFFKNWMTENQEQIKETLNKIIFKEDWDKYANGNISSWEMEVLCFYYHDHELKNANMNKYGFTNYFNLPEEPEVVSVSKFKDREIPKYKISKICGTCIAKNKMKSTVSVLTLYGVVEVKFSKEFFAMFDKKISNRLADGSKITLETSWFDRGSMIAIQGFRRGDNFVPKKYTSTEGHMLYKIDKIYDNGDLDLRSVRFTGNLEEE